MFVQIFSQILQQLFASMFQTICAFLQYLKIFVHGSEPDKF